MSLPCLLALRGHGQRHLAAWTLTSRHDRLVFITEAERASNNGICDGRNQNNLQGVLWEFELNSESTLRIMESKDTDINIEDEIEN